MKLDNPPKKHKTFAVRFLVTIYYRNNEPNAKKLLEEMREDIPIMFDNTDYAERYKILETTTDGIPDTLSAFKQ